MKTLQSNYTTPEQSKRLLELGLPADSADCYYMRMKHVSFENPEICFLPYSEHASFHPSVYEYLPCWSVGRLMEIHDICIEDEDAQYGWAPAGDYNYIDYIISRFEEEIIYFFKLEK